MWENNDIETLSNSSLAALIENRIPAVRIESFADSGETHALANALLEHSCRTNSIKQITRLGISQYAQGLRTSKQNYFDLARSLKAEFSDIYAASFSPLDRMISRLENAGFDAGIMSEPGMGDYFAGNGKLRSGATPIHVDFSPQDSAGWAIGKAASQLAWNYYLKVPEEGGELILWDKLWQPEHDCHQVEDNYYYKKAVVDDAPMLRVSVKRGELLILNSRNFHTVSKTSERLTYGSFISVFEDSSLRLWS